MGARLFDGAGATSKQGECQTGSTTAARQPCPTIAQD